jgi:hypothetical protein
MESFTFGSVTGSTVHFLVFCGVAVLAGAGVCALFVVPAARRPELRRFRFLRLLGLAAALGLACVILCLAYLSTWTVFYRIDVGRDEMLLHYYLPRRSIRIPLVNLGDVMRREAGDRFRLHVCTRGGRLYRSAAADASRSEAVLSALASRKP